MKRIGILGGTFDPVHNGHLAMAKKALKDLQLQEVWFMPSVVTPLKDRTLSSFEIRRDLLETALRPYRKLKICLLEKELPIPSYTIQTVRELKKRYPQYQFVWLIGEDQHQNLDKWKDIDALFELIQFAVFSRNGISKLQHPDIIPVSGFDHPASSTAVRQGHFFFMPKAVRRKVLRQGLYFEEIVRSRCSDFRYRHCVSVSELAVLLAKVHHVDMDKARTAGLLHDVTKELNGDKSRRWMEIYYPDKAGLSEKIWHEYTAVLFLKQYLGYCDKAVLRAISHHVEGNDRQDLSRILYIADKIDPLRGYDVSHQLEVSKQDLALGVQLIRSQQKQYLKKKEDLHV